MKFCKMQCSGNDFVLINCFENIFEDTAAAAEFICDRHFGIGCDNLILVMKSVSADYKLRFFNPDGSEAECSVSGLSCAFKYLLDNNYIDKENAKLETMAGTYFVNVHNDNIVINMSEPIFTPQLIPVDYTGDEFINKIVSVDGEEYAITCVSVGTPYAIIFVDNLNDIDINTLGRSIELHQIFPKRTNVAFVRKADDTTLEMRIWSRGNGEVLSSGSASCAALAAAVENNICGNKATVKNIGGSYEIEWIEDIIVSSKPLKVFSGEIDLE